MKQCIAVHQREEIMVPHSQSPGENLNTQHSVLLSSHIGFDRIHLIMSKVSQEDLMSRILEFWYWLLKEAQTPQGTLASSQHGSLPILSHYFLNMRGIQEGLIHAKKGLWFQKLVDSYAWMPYTVIPMTLVNPRLTAHMWNLPSISLYTL